MTKSQTCHLILRSAQCSRYQSAGGKFGIAHHHAHHLRTRPLLMSHCRILAPAEFPDDAEDFHQNLSPPRPSSQRVPCTSGMNTCFGELASHLSSSSISAYLISYCYEQDACPVFCFFYTSQIALLEAEIGQGGECLPSRYRPEDRDWNLIVNL
jgi:hypothetical protein